MEHTLPFALILLGLFIYQHMPSAENKFGAK
jgi:hypothetical protein